ncbi:MAG: hypothetical protein KKB39_06030 [Nanoarchaeota archaeon]|nr:hypothetical protein [Nanoarchaeota archaeon]
MVDFNIFLIEYIWYEGEHKEVLIGKKVEEENFEKDLIKAKQFAESLIGKKIKCGKEYLGEGYSTECLPTFYEQILWFLTKKLGYIYCYYNEDINYEIDEEYDNKIQIIKHMKKKEIKKLK